MRTVQPGRVFRGRILTIALLSSVITVAAAGRAHGDTRTWIGPAGGTWSVDTNWQPNGPLSATDDLVFPAGGSASSVNDSGYSAHSIFHAYFACDPY